MAGFNPIAGELRGGWLRRVGKFLGGFNSVIRFGRTEASGGLRGVSMLVDEWASASGASAFATRDSRSRTNLFRVLSNIADDPTELGRLFDRFYPKDKNLLFLSSDLNVGALSGKFNPGNPKDLNLFSTVFHETGHLALRSGKLTIPSEFTSNVKPLASIISKAHNLSLAQSTEELFVETAAQRAAMRINRSLFRKSYTPAYGISPEVSEIVGPDIDFDSIVKNGLRGSDHGKNAHGAIQGMMPDRPDFKGARTPGNPDSSSVIDSVKRFFVGDRSTDVGSMNKSVHELADDVLVQASKKAKKASKEALGLYSMAPGGVKSAVKVGGVLAVGVGALSLIRGMFERERDAQPVSFDATQLINAKKDPGRYYSSKSRW